MKINIFELALKVCKRTGRYSVDAFLDNATKIRKWIDENPKLFDYLINGKPIKKSLLNYYKYKKGLKFL
ncbi:MAG: hypothetical protein J7K20_02055 [Thermodesulfobacterium sp.]|nr:hypothetical protein [Thermodesulfobacterium sp.]